MNQPSDSPRSSKSHSLDSYAVYERYLQLHEMTKTHRREVLQRNTKRIKKGKAPVEDHSGEMDNFQLPQVCTTASLYHWTDFETSAASSYPAIILW